MMEETHALLRHNCPDPDCEYVAPGWGDLKLHVRGIHEKRLWSVLCLLLPTQQHIS
jgi:E3 ubiquitin-protein ligase ZNF598